MATTSGSGATRGGEDFHNEDAFLVEEGVGLYIVCDGWGSHPAGEVASHLAIEAVEAFLERNDAALHEKPASISMIDGAVRHALDEVIEAGHSRPEFEGMATTLTLLLVQGERGIIGHVGDSRAYLVRRGRCVLLTSDHEWTDEVIERRESGDDSVPPIETFGLQLRPGDTVILCTDGAESELDDDELVHSIGALTPQIIASRIVSSAHRRRPDSDATAVVVRVRDGHERAWLELSHRPRNLAFGHTLSYA